MKKKFNVIIRYLLTNTQCALIFKYAFIVITVSLKQLCTLSGVYFVNLLPFSVVTMSSYAPSTQNVAVNFKVFSQAKFRVTMEFSSCLSKIAGQCLLSKNTVRGTFTGPFTKSNSGYK